ncbi:MAG TPA: FAD-dependent oxidoreductase, partial [Dongiaceae bacterium]|nr:FAD-dependent oxidoreductase [Dongiaceae bacterium]
MLPALFPSKLLRYGFKKKYPAQRFIPKQQDLKSSYDVVIIGGGGHALACAYYLARNHGITNVCILEKGYLAGGNTARNTAIIRSNYLTPEGVKFYEQSLELYRGLSQDFDFNILYSERGHFTLAHTDAAVRTSRWRAEVNKQLGVNSELIYPDEIARLCPHLNMSDKVRYPILGALYHPPGSIARHDAVAWGYARGAAALGVEIHQQTPVTGMIIENGAIKGVETPRGRVYANKVMQAVAGSTSVVAKMAGFRLPIRTIPLQACVSVPLKPFLDQIIVSGS